MYRVELARSLRRWRMWVIALVLTGIASLIVLGIALSPSTEGGGPPLAAMTARNGFFAAILALLLTQFLLFPLAASIFSGDAVAGDASKGVLRYLLIRPVGRRTLVMAKFGAAMTVVGVEIVIVTVVGLVLGGIFLGIGSVTSISGDTLGPLTVSFRLIGAMIYIAVDLAPIVAIGIFFSSIMDSAPGAIGATFGLYIVEQIVGSVPQARAIYPYLLGQDSSAIVDLFRAPISWHAMSHGALVAAVYTALFLGTALIIFTRKDITS